MNTARLRLWWALLKHPTNIRMVMATLVEFTGIGLILYGLYLVHTFAFHHWNGRSVFIVSTRIIKEG